MSFFETLGDDQLQNLLEEEEQGTYFIEKVSNEEYEYKIYIKRFSTSTNEVQVTRRDHRDRTRARTLCCFGLFFSSFELAKNLLIMGPNNTKNSSFKCDCLIFNYQNLIFIVKKHHI